MEEKNNILKIKVQIDEEEIRLNHYLKNNANCSSRFIRKAAREGRIKVNNENVRLSYMLKNDDIIELQINREENQDIVPEKMNLEDRKSVV